MILLAHLARVGFPGGRRQLRYDPARYQGGNVR
jgi:hypothetical protein